MLQVQSEEIWTIILTSDITRILLRYVGLAMFSGVSRHLREQVGETMKGLETISIWDPNTRSFFECSRGDLLPLLAPTRVTGIHRAFWGHVRFLDLSDCYFSSRRGSQPPDFNETI
jgi:hypothetical protein